MRLEAEPPPEREAWLRLLAENRDALRGWAVHTAAVKLFWRGKEARVHASRGQQRLCAIALRMAECAVVAERLGCFPILLLDDALEAMDSRYQSYVLAWLEAYPGQAMISAPSLPSGFTGAVIRMEE
ncbi:MAG: hypothetical protein D6771_06040 [Zetaproteobacteria bacterium]|nr:MAG: hypothetical protein D6771_06040 [Zetaproteobacteria bacterium]